MNRFPPNAKFPPAESDFHLQFPDVVANSTVLPNGLTVLVREDRSAPVASVQAWVNTGSIHEGNHLGAGMSHLLEHMLFKGTATRSPNQIARAVQDEGGYVNAYTSFDRTVYWIDVPSTGVNVALEILADATMNSTLPPEEFVKEQEVIRREFAMLADDPDRVNSQQLFATAYRTHPYRHPIIGHLALFNQLTRDEVMAYYKARYTPNNIFFVVAGDVRADDVLAKLGELFAPHEARPQPPVLVPEEPPQTGRREAALDFATELSRTVAAWHVPAVTHPDVPALEVLATALGDGRSARLYRRVRETGFAHGASAWSYVPGHPGLFGLDLTTDPDKRAKALEVSFEVIAEVLQRGLEAAEIAKAKKIILANQLHGLSTMRGQANDLGANWMLTGNLNFTRDFLSAIARVTNEDIIRVSRQYLHDQNLTITSVNPTGTKIARTAEQGPAGGAVKLFTLTNGLRLVVREDPRLPLVSMHAVFKGGLLTESPPDAGLSRLFARVLPKGTTHRSAEEIAEQIEAVGGSISADAGNNSISVSVEVLQPDVELGLDLLAELVLDANFPEAVIEREKQIQLAGIKAEDEHMSSAARNLLRANLFAGHPYALRASGSPESVGSITRAKLVEYRDRLFAAHNGVIAIFGNIEAAKVLARVESLFGSMSPGRAALEKPPVPAPLAESRTVEQTKPDKEQAVLMIGYQTVDLRHPDKLAFDVIDEACGDLGSRFFVRIREELGLAYFVGSAQLEGLAPGGMIFYLGTDPVKLTAVRAAFESEIAALARDGLTPEEFQRARKKLLGRQAISMQSNASLGFHVALDELYGRGHDHYLRLESDLQALTLERVNRVAREFFHERPNVVAVVKPA